MDDECENLRMKETKNELASFISSLNIGSEEMFIEKYWQLVGGEISDANYNMVELVILAWSKEIHLVINLNEDLVERNDVDDHSTPIVKLPQAHEIV
jgi:hypothetical protein